MNIKEIANKAGVSVATISRVLNHPDMVQEETRKHVLSIIEEYNYTPNWFARSLNVNRTNTIALIIPNIENDIYQSIATGVELVAHKKNHIILLCNTHNELRNELNYLNMIITRKVDGVIFVSSMLDKEHISKLDNGKIPYVFVGKDENFNNANRCYINFYESAYKMTKHLIELGHRQIDLVIDELSKSKRRDMIKGYNKAMESSSLELGDIHTCPSSIAGGYLMGKKLISQGKLARAIFTSDDPIALGLMKAAREENISMPSQLAIAGFSDSSMATLIQPELTSVEQPSKKLGMVATRMLFDLLDDEYVKDKTQEIILHSTLKIRNSCGNEKYIYELFK